MVWGGGHSKGIERNMIIFVAVWNKMIRVDHGEGKIWVKSWRYEGVSLRLSKGRAYQIEEKARAKASQWDYAGVFEEYQGSYCRRLCKEMIDRGGQITGSYLVRLCKSLWAFWILFGGKWAALGEFWAEDMIWHVAIKLKQTKKLSG